MTKEIRYEGSVNLIFNSKSFTLSSPMQSQDVYFPMIMIGGERNLDIVVKVCWVKKKELKTVHI